MKYLLYLMHVLTFVVGILYYYPKEHDKRLWKQDLWASIQNITLTFMCIIPLEMPEYTSSVLRDLYLFPFYMLAIDFYFYFVHYTFHTIPLLYQFHQDHHHYYRINAASTFDGSFLEHIILNVGSTIVPQFYFQVSNTLMVGIVILSTITGIIAHAGYPIHTLHHTQLHYNYGVVFNLSDKLFGTFKQ